MTPENSKVLCRYATLCRSLEPALAGEGNTSDSQRVAIERVKEKMKEEAQKLEDMHASQRAHLEDVRPHSEALYAGASRSRHFVWHTLILYISLPCIACLQLQAVL